MTRFALSSLLLLACAHPARAFPPEEGWSPLPPPPPARLVAPPSLVAGPPTHTLDLSHPPPHTVVFEADRAAVIFSWATDAPCDEVPAGGRVPLAELPAALARACNDAPCIDAAVVSAAGGPRDDVERVLAAAAKLGTPDFRFATRAPGSAPHATFLCADPIVVLTPSQKLAQAVGVQYGAMNACYETAFNRNAAEYDPLDDADSVTLRLVVEPYGRVSEAAAEASTFRDPDALRCIAYHARDIVFPARTFGLGVRTVLYPLRFAARSPRAVHRDARGRVIPPKP